MLPCNELTTHPGCTLPTPNDCWDRLQQTMISLGTRWMMTWTTRQTWEKDFGIAVRDRRSGLKSLKFLRVNGPKIALQACYTCYWQQKIHVTNCLVCLIFKSYRFLAMLATFGLVLTDILFMSKYAWIQYSWYLGLHWQYTKYFFLHDDFWC